MFKGPEVGGSNGYCLKVGFVAIAICMMMAYLLYYLYVNRFIDTLVGRLS